MVITIASAMTTTAAQWTGPGSGEDVEADRHGLQQGLELAAAAGWDHRVPQHQKRSPVTPSSRDDDETVTHQARSPRMDRPTTSAAPMSALSAIGSAILPKSVTSPRLRATRPSTWSVTRRRRRPPTPRSARACRVRRRRTASQGRPAPGRYGRRSTRSPGSHTGTSLTGSVIGSSGRARSELRMRSVIAATREHRRAPDTTAPRDRPVSRVNPRREAYRPVGHAHRAGHRLLCRAWQTTSRVRTRRWRGEVVVRRARTSDVARIKEIVDMYAGRILLEKTS